MWRANGKNVGKKIEVVKIFYFGFEITSKKFSKNNILSYIHIRYIVSLNLNNISLMLYTLSSSKIN